MRMSTKGRFAVNALIDLGLRQDGGPVALASISARQQASLSYLEQLFGRLRRHGIVHSTRGPGGGYTLGRPAADITIAEIVSVVEEPADVAAADAAAEGLSRALWQRLHALVLDHMATISLQSLLDEQRAQGATVEPRRPRRAVVQPNDRHAARAAAPNSVFAFGQSFAQALGR